MSEALSDQAAARGLVFGVSGHRPGPKYSARAEVRSQLAALFGAAPQPFTLISALAEGADRDAAEAALQAGGALHAITPFDDASYESDFVDAASVAAFRDLMARAAPARRLNLPHEAGDASGPQRNAGYEAAGLEMLTTCRALILVWDGAEGPQGGTSTIARAALAVRRPTLWLHAHAAAPPRVRQGGDWRPIDLAAAQAVSDWISA